MPTDRHIRLTLPYAHEYDFRRRGGRRDWQEVYRSNVEVDIRVVDGPIIPLIRTPNDINDDVTCSYEGRLYRQIADPNRLALSPPEFGRRAVRDAPFKYRLGTTYWHWALRDFPRPYYVRSPRFSDQSAMEFGYCPPLFEHGAPKRIDLDKPAQRSRQAQEWYARAFLICGNTVWVEVPQPAWVIEPTKKHQWRLRIETQPSLWQAATTFPLTRNGSVVEGIERVEAFAEELAFELVPGTPPVELFGIVRDVSSISSLAASTLAIANKPFPTVDLSTIDQAGEQELVRQALDAVPRPNFPWCPGRKLEGLDPRSQPLRLHRRWQFEFRQAENWEILKKLWPSDQEIHYRAIANDPNESPTNKTSLEDWEALANFYI
ncbi:hypothetical protein [Bosea sp. 685]|uniref:hypothetical protein n=1 Tax=Bosea sp. 685 TaxID=3080057 RepID=UPI0028930A19|nr:hypothetical protein [Bosea sp. 685]WNJ89580.1 hypothetical protein RMR04_24730 [Bosea sp. 685]